MKLKLTPELSYLIGLWRKRQSFEGLGVKGSPELIEVFSKEVLRQELTTPEKLVSEEKRIYFYHTAYRKFFADIEKEQLDRFKYLNEYAANYLAGMFDAVGDISDKGVVSFTKLGKGDELLLLRLGFHVKKRDGRFVMEKPVIFLAFIKNYVKLFKDHKVFTMLEKLKKK